MNTFNYLPILLIFVLSIPHQPLYAYKKGVIVAVSIGISAAGLYGFYRWLRTEETFNPTIDNLNTLTFKNPYQATLSLDQQQSPLIPSMSIDQLVIKINKNKTPQQAHILVPAQEMGNAKTVLVQKGITTTLQDPTVFIFSRGYARTNTPGTNDNMLQVGGCAMAAYMPIQDNIINNAPCITFDYPDRRRCFNFGQNKDVQCLKLIHEHTLKQNPNANIILVGDCRGAKTILNFATQKPKNIKALVLLSPFFSAHQLTEQVAQNYLSWLPCSSGFLHNFFKLWFPSYNPDTDKLFAANITSISQDIPLFIAHRNRDTLVSTEQVIDFIATLRQAEHKNIHLVATDDATARHSRLTPVKMVQQEVNRFFFTYNLPHNPALLTS